MSSAPGKGSTFTFFMTTEELRQDSEKSFDCIVEDRAIAEEENEFKMKYSEVF